MKRQKNEVSWKIGGEAGFGIMASGAMFAKTCMRAGLYAVDYSEYPSLIRGGHNTYQVSIAPREIWSHRTAVNILIALNQDTIVKHLDELTPGAVIVYDQTDPSFRDWSPKTVTRKDVTLIGLAMTELATQAGGEKLMRNTVAVGATFGLLSLDFSFPSAVVSDMFAGKGEAVVKTNVAVMKAGYEAITSAQAKAFPWDIEPLDDVAPRMLIAGNDAIGLGALQAGCKFYAGYPMTPSTTLLHFMAEYGPKHGVVVHHAEDEIGVINETIGAAFAGVRAMCGTAGGGFSLMTEAVGLAGMTEVGIVVVEAQRGGPSTGMPTWTGQDDLRLVLHASQGDFFKIVIAPADAEECFTLTQEAFNLAERYQTPVIVMTDKHLAEGHVTVPPFALGTVAVDRGKIAETKTLTPDKEFQRYRTDVVDGISPRTLPGTPGGIFLANSDEHDATGNSNEDQDMRLQQMDKRALKQKTLAKVMPQPKLIGLAKADVTLVSWGSTLGAVKEAARMLIEDHKIDVNILPITYINPFPIAAVTKLLNQAKTTIMIEANQSAQMAGWIRQQTGLSVDHTILRYDGRPFDPVSLVADIRKIIKK